MLNRLRSFSRGRLSPGSGPVTPSKEDIITTIDQFGDRIHVNVETGTQPGEDNNNVRRGSADSTTSDGYMDVASDVEPTITSFTHSYNLEWEKLFLKPNYLKHLRNYSMKGNLRSSRFRSAAWKLFLEVLPEDISKWQEKTRNLRNKYEDLKNKLIVNPRKAVDTVDLSLNNPLSQEEESPWNRFFLDNELRLTIKQDVIRTFPEIEFYHSEDVREMMTNILFCFCREHAGRVLLSYRQGMHELLAPIIFILHCDHQAFLHASEIESLGDLVKEVMCPKFLEHDAYAMFSQIMQTVEPWYVSKEVYPTKTKDSTASQPFSRPQDLNPSNVIVTKLTRIQDYLLKKADHELHMHLERHEIAPQIYGIRWIRLLFGREFPMQDLLVLWDAIFADGIGFDLVDFIFVAMLLYIRDLLITSDYPGCLCTLMRYPPVGDIHYIIEKARHIRDPHQIPRPPPYTYQGGHPTDQVRPKENKAYNTAGKGRSGNTALAGISSLTRKMYSGSSRPKSLSVSGRQKMSKSSSEPMNLQTEVSPAAVSVSPGTVPQHKRGSSASLSKVEDSMFQSAPSADSLARLETRSLQSVGSTPDDLSVDSSPTKYSKLPPRKGNKARKITPVEKDAQQKVAAANGILHEKEAMCRYCATKLDVHIEKLQADLLHQSLENEDEVLVAIAGIKQVRDVLKGTLKFSRTLLDENEINITDNHYRMEVTSTSPESTEISPETFQHPHSQDAARAESHSQKKRLFYMSSEEISEVAESPVDSTSSSSLLKSHFEVEMDDYKSDASKARDSASDGQARGLTGGGRWSASAGPDVCESDLSKSWSPESAGSPLTDTSPETDVVEESPNPLYRLRHGSYDS